MIRFNRVTHGPGVWFYAGLMALLGSALLSSALAGCALVTPAAPTPTALATAVVVVQTLTLPPTNTGIAPTPQPATTAATPATVMAPPPAPACVYALDFVADLTIPDDSVMQPGERFVKSWRVRNSGTCAWPPESAWLFVAGDRMDGPASVSMPPTPPGATADISVTLTAPTAPGVAPDGDTGYWQMGLPTGELLPERVYSRIIVGATSPAPPTPTRPVAAATLAPPRIDYFRANVTIADPGDAIELAWGTSNATSITLHKLLPTGQLADHWQVAPAGVFSYDISRSERNATRFMLFASNALGQSAQATLSVTLRCPDAWFFEPAPDECPQSAPLYSPAAEQPFERGVMIWVQANQQIYILFADGNHPRYKIVSDRWREGDPIDDPDLVPPPGLRQPVRGFGFIWREEGSVRERLGWATGQEQGFETAVQVTARFKYNEFYLRALDGAVWRLLPEGSGWEKIQVR